MKQLSAETLKSSVQLPDNFKEAFERITTAAMRIMYSEEMADDVIDQIKTGDGSMGERIGDGVFAIMGILLKESNGTLPPQLFIPAGVFMIAEAADFVEKSGLEEVNDEDIGEAMEEFIGLTMKASGAKGSDLQNALQSVTQKGQQTGAAPAPAAQPAAQPTGGAV